MEEILHVLEKHKLPYYLGSYSALNIYFEKKKQTSNNRNTYVVTELPLYKLAHYFDNIEYPGFPLIDASVTSGGKRYLFKCIDKLVNPLKEPFSVLEFLYNPYTKNFFDPNGIYYSIRETNLHLKEKHFPPWVILFEAAKLISHYHYVLTDTNFYIPSTKDTPPPVCQRELLLGILSGEHPEKGLKLLLRSGFIETYWPEIFSMTKTKHSKDFHPEGNVWEHSLETLKHRKQLDTDLSLAMFLHDIGKPFTVSRGEKRFYQHSDMGAKIARRLLTRLYFGKTTIDKVTFLIKYHMLPHALPQMPLYRTEKLMSSPYFPLLLEIYRADLLSTYSNSLGYYEACRVYQNYLRRKNNPFKHISKYYSTERTG